jgi:hypothetical protein
MDTVTFSLLSDMVVEFCKMDVQCMLTLIDALK